MTVMAGGREEWNGVTCVGTSGSCGRNHNMVGGVIESGCKARLVRRVLCERAHLVVARDEVGEQLRYYARELLRSVAGQGHRSRAQAVGAGETRQARNSETWLCGGAETSSKRGGSLRL